MSIFSRWAGLGVTFRTMFRKKFTEEYPLKPKAVSYTHLTLPTIYSV